MIGTLPGWSTRDSRVDAARDADEQVRLRRDGHARPHEDHAAAQPRHDELAVAVDGREAGGDEARVAPAPGDERGEPQRLADEDVHEPGRRIRVRARDVTRRQRRGRERLRRPPHLVVERVPDDGARRGRVRVRDVDRPGEGGRAADAEDDAGAAERRRALAGGERRPLRRRGSRPAATSPSRGRRS